jgi:EAL domain-containing protein (putative c-di-GMP-specific phosphodiesterase class I)
VLRKLLGAYRSIRPEVRGVAHLNLCNDTLADAEFCAFVEAELKRTQTMSELLCFEFPGKEMNYPASAVALAEGLYKIGCQISVGAMDDGEIPFRPIKEFGAKFLKIGGRLIQDLATSETTAAEVKTAANACRSFDVQTIAQNVENAPTLNLLRKLDISLAQGYGIARPGLLGRMNNPAA